MKGNRYKRRSAPNLKLLAGIFLVLLIAIGGGASLLLRNDPPVPAPQAITVATQPATVDVLLPTRNLDEGIELKAELFRKETRAAADFVGVAVVGGFDQLSGAYAKSFVAAGQPLLSDHITFRPPVNSVVPQIRVGYRAITIKLDKQTTNEGWARAGVRVDVLWASKQGNTTQAVIIAQNLRVLSSGTSVSSEFGGESKMIQNGESTVTLEVSADDQKRIKLAAGKGEMRLLLRGDEDTVELSEKTKISVEQVISGPAENSKAMPSDQGWVVIDGRKYRVVGTMLVPG
jgi:Flp pilus assembly protein CpaB